MLRPPPTAGAGRGGPGWSVPARAPAARVVDIRLLRPASCRSEPRHHPRHRRGAGRLLPAAMARLKGPGGVSTSHMLGGQFVDEAREGIWLCHCRRRGGYCRAKLIVQTSSGPGVIPRHRPAAPFPPPRPLSSHSSVHLAPLRRETTPSSPSPRAGTPRENSSPLAALEAVDQRDLLLRSSLSLSMISANVFEETPAGSLRTSFQRLHHVALRFLFRRPGVSGALVRFVAHGRVIAALVDWY